MMRFSATRMLGFTVPAVLLAWVVGCGGGGGGGVTPQPINSAPTITLVSPSSGSTSLDLSKSKTMDIKVQVDDPDGGNVDLVTTWSGGSVTPARTTVKAGSQVILTFTAPEYSGACTLEMAVNDGQATARKTLDINVTGGTGSGGVQISDINVSPDPVKPGATATVTSEVKNPQSKTLTYTWTSPNGGTITGAGPSVTWKAPNTSGSYGIYLKVSDGTDSVQSSVIAVVSSADGGLLGTYFKTTRDRDWVVFTNQLMSRVDPNLDLNWGSVGPDPSKVPGEGFGVRWTGFIRIDTAGTYAFRAFVDDGIRMKIMNDANQWVEAIPNNSENWKDHVEGAWLPVNGELVPLHFDGGKWYPVQIEYFQGGSQSFIHLYWTVGGGSQKIIPQSALKAS